jgi:transcription initiation factor TFIID subunit 7
MSDNSKKRASASKDPIDDGPYIRPTLEEQLIIRFPPDLAMRLSDLLEDDDNAPPQDHRFEDLWICFTDERHARVRIFDEELEGVLVKLPAYVESHRTVDGSHLFKSADISEMLIVYRHNLPPQGVLDDFTFEHGLTPPMRDIVSKRQAKTEHAKSQQDANLLEGIDYWEIVEIQLAALVSKEHSAKPVCRHEFHEEPDEDPVLLEKVLRKHRFPEPLANTDFRGYSGFDIPDEELEEVAPDDEPIVQIPPEVFGPVDVSPKEEEVDITVSEEEDSVEIGSSPAASSQITATEGDTEADTESESIEEDEEEEENKVDDLKSQLEVLVSTRHRMIENAENARNEDVKAKYMVTVQNLDERIESFRRQIAELEQ